LYRPIVYLGIVALLLCALPDTFAAKAKPIVHVVKRGDTLSEIAQRYRVSRRQLRQWNSLHSDKILVGQRLELWNEVPSSYKVRKGDTLSGIAQRFGLPSASLRRLNGLTKDRIYPGQRLKLEQPTTHLVKRGDTLSEIAEQYSLGLTQLQQFNDLSNNVIAVGQTLRLQPRPARPAQTDDDEPDEYVVKKGDNLSQIAQRFRVGLRLLRRLNNLKSDRIQPGQKLKLRPTALDEAVHIVREGETISAISLKYSIAASELQRLNGLEDSKILIGQKLRLKAVPRATHIVERGDALWEIARAYGMNVTELKELNEMSSNLIYPGQELVLNPQKAQRFATYTVKKGDYLGQIARLHQMSVAALQQANNLKNSIIHPGDELKVKPLLSQGRESIKISEINWDALQVSLGGVKKITAASGPYYYSRPKRKSQKNKDYFESASRSPLQTYQRARKLWDAFAREVGQLGRLSDQLEGWHIVLDPGHGGLDPGTIVRAKDGNGKSLYVVEDEYVHDIALRVYVLLRLHGAEVTPTILSPNHLIRQSNPATRTFVHEKNEVYNSYTLNRKKSRPRGTLKGLRARVDIARNAFAHTPKDRRIFLSFHADNSPHDPEAPLVLYYQSNDGSRRDLASRNFAKVLRPALGAGTRVRGQGLAVLRDNPAAVGVLLEIRNLAYRNNPWALRFEEYRHRDAEKVVKGLLDYAKLQRRSAKR
jgi:LysM repeat protein